MLLVLACWVNIGIVAMLAIGTVVKGARTFGSSGPGSGGGGHGTGSAISAGAHTVTALAAPAQWPSGCGFSCLKVHPALSEVRVRDRAAAAVAASLPGYGRQARRQTAGNCRDRRHGCRHVDRDRHVVMGRYEPVFVPLHVSTLMIVGVGAATVFTALFTSRKKEWSAAAVMLLVA